MVDDGLMFFLDKEKADRTFEEANRTSEEAQKTSVEVGKITKKKRSKGEGMEGGSRSSLLHGLPAEMRTFLQEREESIKERKKAVTKFKWLNVKDGGN